MGSLLPAEWPMHIIQNTTAVKTVGALFIMYANINFCRKLAFGLLLVLFVLYLDCNRHAFAILYNDAVMQN